jgi:predicted MFS family arabinose efflux permease
MTLQTAVKQKLSDSFNYRWASLLIVSITMMMGYFLTDVMAPLEPMLEDSVSHGGLGWPSSDYGVFSGAYGLINVFLFMLFFGGIVLDKMGIRFTGNLSCLLMVVGALIKFYAIQYMSTEGTTYINIPFIGSYTGLDHAIKNQVLIASLGFAIFGVGCETIGITISKVMTKWFTGHELALAMGVQVALARLGTALVFIVSIPIAKKFSLSAPLLLGIILLIVGLLLWLVYDVLDIKLDKSDSEANELAKDSEEDKFHMRDLGLIFKNPGFWLITVMCLCFYGAIFPYLKFATKVMVVKYHVSPDYAGIIPSLMPFGTIILTPIFGGIYDKIGKGATLMILGSVLLTLVHIFFALPVLETAWFAVLLIILLGVAFSLVPSAMWPSVPKIIPMKQLGSAYAIIFYIQNIGLTLIPMLMGTIIEKNTVNGVPHFFVPMMTFAVFGVAAVFFGIILKILDAKKGYGLEKPNIK